MQAQESSQKIVNKLRSKHQRIKTTVKRVVRPRLVEQSRDSVFFRNPFYKRAEKRVHAKATKELAGLFPKNFLKQIYVHNLISVKMINSVALETEGSTQANLQQTDHNIQRLQSLRTAGAVFRNSLRELPARLYSVLAARLELPQQSNLTKETLGNDKINNNKRGDEAAVDVEDEIEQIQEEEMSDAASLCSIGLVSNNSPNRPIMHPSNNVATPLSYFGDDLKDVDELNNLFLHK